MKLRIELSTNNFILTA